MIEINVGDEVFIKDDDAYDILTVLSIKKDYAECFEYNSKHAFYVKLETLEKI